jgi:very-short-patch-repair endonuclease
VARRDAKRDQDLTMAGWRVFRVRWAQLVNDAPRTAATVRRLLEDQRRLLAATRR